MKILVFNSGSSSLKVRLFEIKGKEHLDSLFRGSIGGFGAGAQGQWAVNGKNRRARADIRNHRQAVQWAMDLMESEGLRRADLAGVGHRVVHGGSLMAETVLITKEVLKKIDVLRPLAPLHNPASAEVIRACRERLGREIPMLAVFDTSFHRTIPAYAATYGLPHDWVQAGNIRRYGFHGIAHRYLYERYLEIQDSPPRSGKVITLQLGHGCSMAAIKNGCSVETSMGFTPLEGLMMATRPGDVDPGVILFLLSERGLTLNQVTEGLSRRSGLLGISCLTANMKDLLQQEARGHTGANLAIDAFCHRARKYLGAYLAVLGGADAVLFGGGIGENAPEIRARICAGMAWCGLRLDGQRNRKAVGVEARISRSTSSCAVYVIPVDEESVMAKEIYSFFSERGRENGPTKRHGRGTGRKSGRPIPKK